MSHAFAQSYDHISNLVNMYYGESQKLTEAVFSLAHKLQPSIIFIDEIDSFLSTRSSHDNEATRMMKTQFMALWDGLLSETDSRILVMGATNRPSDLDSAILRRLPYKVKVPLPNAAQRLQILKIHLKGEPLDNSVNAKYLQEFANRAEGLSGSDLFEICREAALRGLKDWLNSSEADGQLKLEKIIQWLNLFFMDEGITFIGRLTSRDLLGLKTSFLEYFKSARLELSSQGGNSSEKLSVFHVDFLQFNVKKNGGFSRLCPFCRIRKSFEEARIECNVNGADDIPICGVLIHQYEYKMCDMALNINSVD
ncbi:hypothetical protein ACTXT7_004200 [Hymenolepis weldensis]